MKKSLLVCSGNALSISSLPNPVYHLKPTVSVSTVVRSFVVSKRLILLSRRVLSLVKLSGLITLNLLYSKLLLLKSNNSRVLPSLAKSAGNVFNPYALIVSSFRFPSANSQISGPSSILFKNVLVFPEKYMDFAVLRYLIW